MNTSNFDLRRRGLLQQFVPVDLSTDWTVPQVMRAKSTRSLALAGTADYVKHGLQFERPSGLIEISGGRVGKWETTLLIVFSQFRCENVPSFLLSDDTALGVWVHPTAAFGGFLQILHSPSVYFRLGGSGADNCVASDLDMLQPYTA